MRLLISDHFLAVLVGMLLTLLPAAKGCKCVPSTLPESYKGSSDVMKVRILSGPGVNKKKQEKVYAAVVLKKYKGKTKNGQNVLLKTRQYSASCGATLKKGVRLVTVDKESPGVFGINICDYYKSWKQVKKIDEDMAFLDGL